VALEKQGAPIMSDERASETSADIVQNPSLYDGNNTVLPAYLAHIGAAIADRDTLTLSEDVAGLHETELADLLEALQPEQRNALVQLLGKEFDFSALTELDEAIRMDIVDSLPSDQLADAVQELDSDDAVYILEDMDEDEQEAILAQLPFTERVRLRRALDYPEDSAGRRMQSEFVAVPAYWTVGQTIDYMRDETDLPERFSQIHVIDPSFKLTGAVDLDRLLRTKREVKIDDIMHETRHAIPATMDQEEAAQIIQQYNLLSAAVVDESERLVGVLTIDDVLDVLQEEADEDIKRLGGVGDEEISDRFFETIKSRWPWLLVNLATAFFSSFIIGLFGGSIEKMVALAVLMPIVASMGGNAGTQTMTVTVRALATRDLDIYNAVRVIRREAFIGIANGALFALLVGSVAALWFHQGALGAVIGAAMMVNLFSAAIAGILIPLLLEKAGADPALASTVFVTTVTDTVGFFAFLGIATWWFGL
jgi:magnesium transporter